MTVDAIDAAIAAAAQPIERRAQTDLTIASTGRHVMLDFPVDLTDAELCEFAAWVLLNFRAAAVAGRGASDRRSRIIVPAGTLAQAIDHAPGP